MKKVLVFCFVFLLMGSIAGCTKNNGSEAVFNKDVTYDFTYIDVDGNLRARTLASDRDDILIKKEFQNSIEYEVNWKEHLVAYVWIGDDEMDSEFVLYNLLKSERTVLSENAHIGRVKWSPNGRYLLLDVGTYIWRSISIYDAMTATITPIEFSVYPKNLINVWSPDGNKIAVGIEEEVTPETPVGDGESITTAIIDVENKFSLTAIAQGTSDYYTTPELWLDNKTIVIKKEYFEGKHEYEKIDFVSNVVSKYNDTDLSGIIIPEEFARYSHSVSSDKKHVLYNKGEEILLYSVDTQNTVFVCKGYNPLWRY